MQLAWSFWLVPGVCRNWTRQSQPTVVFYSWASTTASFKRKHRIKVWNQCNLLWKRKRIIVCPAITRIMSNCQSICFLCCFCYPNKCIVLSLSPLPIQAHGVLCKTSASAHMTLFLLIYGYQPSSLSLSLEGRMFVRLFKRPWENLTHKQASSPRWW